MDEILDLPQTEFRKVPYAGFWIRVGAYIIDYIILWVFNLLIGKFALAVNGSIQWNWQANVIYFVIGVIYFTLMESSEKQGTLGKMLLNLKVGDSNGQQLSMGNALGRKLAKLISSIIFCIGFMMVGWDNKKQGLHDKIANTYVFEV